MRTFHVYNVGKVSFPDDFHKFFDVDGNFIISQAYGENYHFETDAEPLFDLVNQIEEDNGEVLYEYKKKIVTALLDRKKHCNGFFKHRSFRGDEDSQLRATSAIIRTLVAASKDFDVNDEIKEIAAKHFSYYFEWINGIWFCHDSSEREGVLAKGVIQSGVWRKDKANTLTLNTHVDSLSTLLYLLKNKPEYKDDYLDLVNKAIISINQLLTLNEYNNTIKTVIQKFDYSFFTLELNRFLNKKKRLFITKLYDFIIWNNIVKRFFPFIFYNNGFIGRDLAVTNRHFDYHIINMLDLLRLCAIYLETKRLHPVELLDTERLLAKIKKGFTFIDTKLFTNYIQEDLSESAAYQECITLYNSLIQKRHSAISFPADIHFIKSKFLFD